MERPLSEPALITSLPSIFLLVEIVPVEPSRSASPMLFPLLPRTSYSSVEVAPMAPMIHPLCVLSFDCDFAETSPSDSGLFAVGLPSAQHRMLANVTHSELGRCCHDWAFPVLTLCHIFPGWPAGSSCPIIPVKAILDQLTVS